jgi:hypothetical protein
MSKMKPLRISLVALVGLIATPANAQDDWDLGRDPGRKLTIAAVTYENFGVAVRCVDGVMSVVVSGLPQGSGLRTIRHQIGDEAEVTGRWVSAGDGGAAFSVWPAATAAYLARGGRWVLDVPDNGRITRISADLPASPGAIGEVFTACGRTLSPTSLQDEPDGEDFGGLRWVDVPIAEFPTRTDAAGGLAALSCTADRRGNMRGCKVESEFPDGAGFGRAAVIAAHRRGRVGPPPGVDADIEGRRMIFMVRFNLRDDQAPLPAAPSRLPPRPEQLTRPPAGAD